MFKFNLTTIDKIILVLTIMLVFVANPLLLIFAPKIMNPLSTYLFQFLSLIFSVFISYRISVANVMNKTIELQKNTAKTAVRHIRIYGQNIQNLIDNISVKISSSKNKYQSSYLMEIINHLRNIRIGINSSENDFKDILGEELKEENKIVSELFSDMQILKSKIVEVDKLRKDKEKTNKQQLDTLAEEINILRSKISDNYFQLPIGSSVNLPSKNLTLSPDISNIPSVSPQLAEFIKRIREFGSTVKHNDKDSIKAKDQNKKNSK